MFICCWSGCSSGGGFIWIIFRDLVGGGGSAKSSPAVAAVVVGGRRREMICSVVANGEMVRKDDEELFEALEDREPSSRGIAGGGSLKESSSEERFRPSLAEMSVDETGVGGRAGGGITTR